MAEVHSSVRQLAAICPEESWPIASEDPLQASSIGEMPLSDGFQELNREWEQVWQEPAGLEEFHQNFDILQRHIGGFQLAAVDEQNAHRPKPDVLILIFGNVTSDVATKIFGKIDKVAGEVWRDVIHWYREPRGQGALAALMRAFLDLSLASPGSVWAREALQRFAANIPPRMQGRDEALLDLQDRVLGLAGGKKGMLVLNEKLQLKTAGCTVKDLRDLRSCAALADYTALKLNSETAKQTVRLDTPSSWTLMELSGRGLLLHRPSSSGVHQRTRLTR